MIGKKFMEDLQWKHAQQTPKQHRKHDASYLIGRLHKCDEYPSHYMMINKYNVPMQFAWMWSEMDTHLREYVVSLFEGIDVLVSVLLLQDPENASQIYDMALNLGTLKLPQKLP